MVVIVTGVAILLLLIAGGWFLAQERQERQADYELKRREALRTLFEENRR
jgi:hypothetical protein